MTDIHSVSSISTTPAAAPASTPTTDAPAEGGLGTPAPGPVGEFAGDPIPSESWEWHFALLRLAGSLADDLISDTRDWLAQGDHADIALAVSLAAAADQLPILEGDADLIYAELAAAGYDTSVVNDLVQEVEDDYTDPTTPWQFTPVLPGSGDVPAVLDLTGSTDGSTPKPALDRIDQSAVDVVSAESEIAAIWRAWRHPTDAAHLHSSAHSRSGRPRRTDQPKRLYIVAATPTSEDDALPQITHRIQNALTAAGELDPQVELCPAGAILPVYQETARANAALLWAREAPAPLELAKVFDAVDPQQGPLFHPDHPTIQDIDERERLLDYLDVATPVITTGATMRDILDPDRPPIVPLTFRTDGHWIWTDTIGYYLEKHGVAPESRLLAHLRAAPALPPPVSEVSMHRVRSFLAATDDRPPVWMVPRTRAANEPPLPE